MELSLSTSIIAGAYIELIEFALFNVYLLVCLLEIHYLLSTMNIFVVIDNIIIVMAALMSPSIPNTHATDVAYMYRVWAPKEAAAIVHY